jgi:hypothetical protein
LAGSDVIKNPFKPEDMNIKRLREFAREYMRNCANPPRIIVMECTDAQMLSAHRLPSKLLFDEFGYDSQMKYPTAEVAFEYFIFVPNNEGMRINEVRESLKIAEASGMKTSLRDWKFVPGVQPEVKVVGICVMRKMAKGADCGSPTVSLYEDQLFVATENGVYRLEEDVLKPLKFEVEP